MDNVCVRIETPKKQVITDPNYSFMKISSRCHSENYEVIVDNQKQNNRDDITWRKLFQVLIINKKMIYVRVLF